IAATCFSQKTVVFSMLAPVSNRSSKNAEIRISQQVWGLWSAYSERHGNGNPPYDGGNISDTIAVEPGFRFWGHSFDLGEGSYTTYHMTDDTKFAISAVPEPHSYLMLGAGLLALGALRRRAKRATPATANAA
ncbi:PEP-CTERM sorting domain-containing protein, partial [Massilia sp. CCM 8733]